MNDKQKAKLYEKAARLFENARKRIDEARATLEKADAGTFYFQTLDQVASNAKTLREIADALKKGGTK